MWKAIFAPVPGVHLQSAPELEAGSPGGAFGSYALEFSYREKRAGYRFWV
jgi:hypothetical protein